MRIIGKNLEATRETSVVASGTIESGISVVVNSDGTVSAVSETNISEAVGTAVTYDTGAAGENEVVYDSNAQKVVVTYRDTSDSNRGHAVVGTVNASNNSISFGTPVQFTSRNIEWSDATYDSANNKVVIAYADSQGSRYGYAIVGDVSGTSISFGSETVYNSYEVQHVAIGYDAGAQKVVIAYEDWGNSNYGMAIVGTVSGTSISFGTEVVYESARAQKPKLVYDASEQKIVIGFSTYANSEYGYAKVGTVSGTSISFGSAALFESFVIQDLTGTYDSSAQKVVFAYRITSGGLGKAVVGTVSGTSISFGTSVTFNNANTNKPSATFDANVGKICIGYRDAGNSYYGTAISGTVSGTSISFDTEFVINTANSSQFGAAYDASAKKVVFAFYDSGSTDGEAVVYQASGSSQNLTAENFVGMARGRTISESETAGSLVEYHSTDTRGNNVAYDAASGKFVVIFNPGPPTSSPPSGYAIVGTVDPSDNSISYGTAVQFEDGEVYGDYMGITYDSNAEKVVIAYMDTGDSNNSKAIVGTVSGTSISFGTPTTFNGQTQNLTCAFDSTNNKVVIAYKDASNSDYGTAIVGTVSGTSISFGSKVVFNSGNTNNVGICFDSTNDKIIIGYRDQALNQQATAIVGTVSGTSISFGSEVQVSPNSATDCVPIYEPVADKVVFVYSDSSDSNKGTVKIGTVSGTSISFGDAVTFDATSYSQGAGVFDTKTSKVTIAYRGASGYPYIISGTVSGSTITFGDAVQLGSFAAATYRFGCAYDSATYKIASVFIDSDATPDTGESIIFNNSYTERETVATDGNALIIDTQGAINTAQASLTAGQSYYVQTDGTLSTTAGDPSVFAGTAVSSTKLIVKG